MNFELSLETSKLNMNYRQFTDEGANCENFESQYLTKRKS